MRIEAAPAVRRFRGVDKTNCRACGVCRGRVFCNFFGPSSDAFRSLGEVKILPQGARLFAERQPCAGIYVLCWGTVAMTTRDDSGSPQTAQPGDVLGLEESISNRCYGHTAETSSVCQVRFVPKEDLRRFLFHDINACLWAVHFL